ncbi:MAG: hypothetical protein R8J94_07110 [Acidimicrobiia bacterium]|nr:hypothetical protein [Acidimicrobiia bacterium]
MRATVGTASAAGFVGVLASFGPLATSADDVEVARELTEPDTTDAPVALAFTEGVGRTSRPPALSNLPRLVDPAAVAPADPPTIVRLDPVVTRWIPRTTTSTTIAPTTSVAPTTTRAPAAPKAQAPAATTAAPTTAAPTTAAPPTTAPTTVAPTTAAPTTAAPTTTTIAPTTTVTTTGSTTSTTLPPLTGGSN